MTVPALPPPDEAPLLDWALWYASQGWPVFPCYGKVPITRRGFLDATADFGHVRSWWSQWPEANIGLPVQAGQVVLDVDPRNGGSDTMHTLQQLHGALPDTLTSLTGGGGQHLFFTTNGAVKNKARLGDGIDVQAVGSYVIVPPSVHPVTGKRYLWDAAYGPDSIGLAPLPQWLEDLVRLQETQDGSPAAARDPQPAPYRDTGAPILEGQRETTLMRLAGAMQHHGASPEAIRSALEAENQRCVPPLEAEDLDRMTRSVGRYAPAPRLEVSHSAAGSTPSSSSHGSPTAMPLTDYFNARELVERHGTNFRYCKAWRDWLVWTGTHWRRNDLGQIEQWAKETIMALLERLKDCANDKERHTLYRHITASLSTGRLKAMVESADNEPGIRVEPKDFDQHPWLLNCVNGTLDLKTGTLRPHARGDLLTHCLDILYDPHAECALWKRFLETIFAHHPAIIRFVQKVLGYCLTGSVQEQALFIFWGTGANGKSTLVNTVLGLLGSLGMKATEELLMVTKGDRHPTERADLCSKRLVAALESRESSRLNEVFVKEATGGDPIRARRMQENFWQFDPTHKCILATNHKPMIRGTDHAIWRRIHLVPFTVTIPEGEKNPHLLDDLKAEWAGILPWMVRGCLEWQREGLGVPEAVTTATKAYRADMDILARFLEDECVLKPSAQVKATPLYKAYQAWCERNGEHWEPQRTFGKRLTDRRLESYTNNGRWWKGIGLRHPPTEANGTNGTNGT